MQPARSDYTDILKKVFTQKQKANPHFSLRAFAKKMGVHPATLSQVLNGNRRLPIKNIKNVIAYMELSPIEETLFRESFFNTKVKLDHLKVWPDGLERHFVDEAHYSILSEWEYYAVISLFETKNFQPYYEYIAKQLNISKQRVEVVLKHLMTAGFVKIEAETWVLTKGPLRTTEDIPSSAIKKSHREALEMGKSKLDEVAIELRDFSSLTVPTNPKKITEAKSIIREFRQKMAALLRDGDKTEVYQLSMQLYPLTIPKGVSHESK